MSGKTAGDRFDHMNEQGENSLSPLDRRLPGVLYYESQAYDFNFSRLHPVIKTSFRAYEKKPEYPSGEGRHEEP